MHLLIITPIFDPSPGGAATYYSLLVHGLLQHRVVERVTVVTERFPASAPKKTFHPKIEVVGLFPYRAGGEFNRLAQYLRYGFQNLQYAGLPALVRDRRPDLVLVHSSFHNFFNLMTPAIRRISQLVPVVADVRDHQLPPQRLHQLEPYHVLIACAANVEQHLRLHQPLADRIVHIPVVQEKLSPHRESAPATLAKFNLRRGEYLLFGGLIKPGKGIDLLLQVYATLRARGTSEKLVLAGLVKDAALLDQARAVPETRSLGAISRDELLDLMSCARAAINLSESEGMPRTSLEAMALGVPVILPRGIPEFEQYCPGLVARSADSSVLAAQIESVLAHAQPSTYPIEQHAPEIVLPRYSALFAKARQVFAERRPQ